MLKMLIVSLIIKFIDEYECKEIFYKNLTFLDSKTNIDYINSFDVNSLILPYKLIKI